jgi:hypothetical protein
MEAPKGEELVAGYSEEGRLRLLERREFVWERRRRAV